MTIPTHLLVVSGPFGPRLSAAAVSRAIAGGVQAAGGHEPDVLALDRADASLQDLRVRLDALGFDLRMRSARALVVAWPSLEERTLVGSVTFELATRARQSGVPTHAVTAANRLSPFDARILDLQLVRVARTARALALAGTELAELA